MARSVLPPVAVPENGKVRGQQRRQALVFHGELRNSPKTGHKIFSIDTASRRRVPAVAVVSARTDPAAVVSEGERKMAPSAELKTIAANAHNAVVYCRVVGARWNGWKE
jgi:hypothetical protein